MIFSSIKRLQVVDTLLNLEVFAKTNLKFPQDEFLDIVNEFEKEFFMRKPELCFQFRHEMYQYIAEVITPYGLCLSFNIALPNDLLYLNVSSNYFFYQLFQTCDLTGFKNIVKIPEIPRNDTTYSNGMTIRSFINLNNENIIRNATGRHLFVHDPYELPSSGSGHIFLNAHRTSNIVILPQISVIDDSIAGYNPIE